MLSEVLKLNNANKKKVLKSILKYICYVKSIIRSAVGLKSKILGQKYISHTVNFTISQNVRFFIALCFLIYI